MYPHPLCAPQTLHTPQRAGGPGALYYGLAPRLLQQVPSSMMCWYIIHAVQRVLRPYTVVSASSSSHRGGAAAAVLTATAR